MALRDSWGSQQSLDESTTNSLERKYGKDESTSVFVSNLPPRTNFFAFLGHFSRFPSLVGLRLLPLWEINLTRAGFVTFESVVDVENAIKEFNNKPPYNFRMRICRKDREKNPIKNCVNPYSHNYSHEDVEDLAGIDFGRLAVNISPGYEGRRIVVNDKPPNCFSDRAEFSMRQKSSEMFDERESVGAQNKYRDNNECGDGFNRQDSRRYSERTKRYDSRQQRPNGNPQHEPKYNQGSQGRRNFSNSVKEEDRSREMMAKAKQRNDFNKNRQRAKSCERFSSNKSNRPGGNGMSYNVDNDDDETERCPPPNKNQVNHNRKSAPIYDHRDIRNCCETQDTASEMSSADENNLFQVEELKLEMGKTTRCTVTHVENTDNGIFWAQSDPSLADKLENSLAEDAKKGVSIRPKPKVGGIYLIQYDCDNMWYRGKILKTNEKTVDVLFIDYGNSSFNVPTSKIKPLSYEKCKYPAQAVRCKPSKTTVKKYPSCQAFRAAIGGNECDLTVESIHNDYHVVTVDIVSRASISNSTESAKRSPQTDSTAAKRVNEAPKQSLSDMMIKLKNKSKREYDGEKSRSSESNERSTSTPLVKPEEAVRSESPAFVKLSDRKRPSPTFEKQPDRKEPSPTFEKQPDRKEPSPTFEKPSDPKEPSPVAQSKAVMNDELEFAGEQPTKTLVMHREVEPQLGAAKIEEADNSAKDNGSPHFSKFIISQLNVGDKFGLYPMIPESPASLWGTIDSADSSKKLVTGFDPLYDEMDETLISTPLGSLIVAKSTAYGNWGRVVVLSDDTDEPEVFFVDFGNQETVSVIKPILKQHEDLPGLATYVEIDTTKLDEDDKKGLAKCLGDESVFQMVVTEKIDKDRIKAMMLDHKMAPCVLISGQNLLDKKLNKNDKPLVAVENLPRFEKGLRIDAYVVEICSTKQIHVCPTKFYDEIAKLEAVPATSEVREKYAPKVKELVLAKYSLTRQMYRAEVTQVDTDHASVLFIDYGSEDVVSLNEICAIPEELLKIPFCIVAVKDGPQVETRMKGFVNDTLTMLVTDDSCLPVVVEFYKNNINVLSEG